MDWLKALVASVMRSDAKVSASESPKASQGPLENSLRRSQEEADTGVSIALVENWLRINGELSYYKPVLSPNRRWVLGRRDDDGVGRGGYREQGNGAIALGDIESGLLVHEHRLIARPVNVAVSNSGCYVVADGGFGMALQGDLVAFDVSARESFRRHYEANIFNVGLSPCGRYAAVQTANAPSDDGNLLEVVDLRGRERVLAIRSPRTGWADGYAFELRADGALSVLHVHLMKLGSFRYSADGTFLDAAALVTAELERGDFSTKLCAARRLIEDQPDQAGAEVALRAADAALQEGAQDRQDWAAVAHRVRGEACEFLGRDAEALVAYEQALALDDKIGIKRRAAALRKRLAKKTAL